MFKLNVPPFFCKLTSPLVFCILLILGFVVYFNVIFYPFVHDELVFILQNPSIGDLNIKNIFLNPPVASKDFSLVNTYYRPFLELFNRLLFKVFHFNPQGYHVVNILFHVFNSFFVFQITQFLREKRRTLSLVLAVIFLIHPIQSEAVACVSGISNLLFTFFGLLSFIFYLNSRKDNFFCPYMASLLLFFICLFVKEQAVIFPFLILLYEFCFFSNLNWLRVFKRAAGFFIVLAGYFFIRTLLIGFPITEMGKEDPEFWLRIGSIPGNFLVSLGLVLFPRNLHYYRMVDILQPFILPTIIFFVILMGTGYLISVAKQERRLLIFGLWWFFLSQLPTLNIIPIVNEYSFLLAAEHFIYFPLVGILLSAGGLGLYFISLCPENIRLKINILGVVVFCFVSFIFMVATIKQNTYWKSDIALFERTLQFEKNFGRGHLLLAQSYVAKREWQKASLEYEKALVIMQGYLSKIKNEDVKPFYEGYIKDIDAGVSYCYLQLGEFSKAASYLERISQGDSKNLAVKNSLAICYLELGYLEQGENVLRNIVEQDPTFLPAKQNLKRLLSKKLEQKEETKFPLP